MAEGKSSKGFTIIEIMIAIFIFSIMVTILFSSHNLVLSNTESILDAMDAVETAKNCIDRMVSDLGSIYLSLPPSYTPPGIDGPPDPYRIVGDVTDVNLVEFDRLRFASSAHLPIGFSPVIDGIAEIVYYAMADEDESVVLRRADHLYPFEEFEENASDPILCTSLRSLQFTYYDDEGADFESWDSESPDVKYATPRAIGIALEIGDPEAPHRYETKVYFPIFRRPVK